MLRWVVIAASLACGVLLCIPLTGCRGGAGGERVQTGVTTPLHREAAGGNMSDVQRLVDGGADVNARDEHGMTPLHWAAQNGHEGTSGVLLKGGANPTIKDDQNKTPADYAREHRHDPVLAVLRTATAATPTAEAPRNRETAQVTPAPVKREESKKSRVTTPLHEAAGSGRLDTVQRLLKEGADPNAIDEHGRTPLHLSAEHGHGQTSQALLSGGANPNVVDDQKKAPVDYAMANGHSGTVAILRSAAPRGPAPAASATPKEEPKSEEAKQGLNPSLKYPDLEHFQTAIGQPACLLTSEHVYFFAPKSREAEAGVVLPYLVRAYDELHRITGMHTQYTIVVYNFPKGNAEAFGGTSNCTLWYDDSNLNLNQFEEWRRFKVPHVSGYIEEMGHNFVAATRAQFGWEMMGWSIGAKASMLVAGNPLFTQSVAQTRETQTKTFRRYKELGNTFPPDIESNLVDRIHAYILWQCEEQYGPNFWPDVFKELRGARGRFEEAAYSSKDDDSRNKRYQITVECIDRLSGIHFKQRLQESGISLVTDVKSLHPTEPGWNRKLQ